MSNMVKLFVLVALLVSCNESSVPTLPDEVIIVVGAFELEYTVVYTDIEFFLATPDSLEIVGTQRELDTIGFRIHRLYEACSVLSVIVFPEALQPAEMICQEDHD